MKNTHYRCKSSVDERLYYLVRKRDHHEGVSRPNVQIIRFHGVLWKTLTYTWLACEHNTSIELTLLILSLFPWQFKSKSYSWWYALLFLYKVELVLENTLCSVFINSHLGEVLKTEPLIAFYYKGTWSLDFKKFKINTLFSVCQCDEFLILGITEDLRTGYRCSLSLSSLCFHIYTHIHVYGYAYILCVSNIFILFILFGGSFVGMARS